MDDFKHGDVRTITVRLHKMGWFGRLKVVWAVSRGSTFTFKAARDTTLPLPEVGDRKVVL